MKLVDWLNKVEDSVVAFLKSPAVLRLFAALVILAEVSRRLFPQVSWVQNASEALVYLGASLGIVSQGLRKPNG